jgi:CrcB protein
MEPATPGRRRLSTHPGGGRPSAVRLARPTAARYKRPAVGTVQKLLALALAGALGTLCRYALAGLVQRAADGLFPWGTLAVNVLGCLLFGAAWALAQERFVLSGETRAVVLVGFLGAFTTFSTFAFETGAMLRDADWGLAAANVLAQNLLGVAGFLLGLVLGRILV